MTEEPQKYRPLRDDLETANDQQAPTSDTAGTTTLIGWLANRIKTITGRSVWTDNPPTNLTEAKSHHDHRQNPHVVTRAQLGAAAQTALDSHTADQLNPHVVTAAQAGAPPTTRTISTTAPLAGGGSLAANRTLSITAATQSAAGSMSATDKAKLDGLDSANYAPASHVGSGGSAHPAATANAAGFITGANQQKLDSLAIPPRIYVAPSWSRQDITVSSVGWVSTLLFPEVTVPALGQPPAGFAWLIDVVGSMRFINRSTTSPATILIQIQYNRAAVGSSVDGGNSAAANSQTITVLTSYGLTPPTLTQSFTVNFYGFYDTATTYSLFAGPFPTVRAYLVAA